jgi:metal-responsive CopG/Arc/MetJ family transcriptional regulator
MAVDKDREIVQMNIRVYKDQLPRLDRIWKLKELDSRSELIRMQLDKLFEEEKEILKGL